MASKSISISQIQTFNQCPYKWHLTYQRNLSRIEAEVSPASLGTLFHIGMAAVCRAFYTSKLIINAELIDEGQRAIGAWVAENQPPLQAIEIDGYEMPQENSWFQMMTDAMLLVDRTVRHFDFEENRRRFVVADHEGTPLVEYKFVWKNAIEPLDFIGVVDAVFKDLHTGEYFLVDWKTKAQFNDFDDEHLNAQLALYQHALWQVLDIPVTRAVLYQIKSRPPQLPRMLKNGTMSRDKGQNTDWLMYYQALLDSGLDPMEYIEEMKPSLDAKEFFRPLHTFRVPATLHHIWNNFVNQVTLLNEAQVFPQALSSYTCRGCTFRQWCSAKIDGLPTDDLIGEAYKVYEPLQENSDD